MEGTKAKGEYRCLTPQEISSTVVMFRKMMDWKQLTLALEAGVNERTVQRIERGEKVDARDVTFKSFPRTSNNRTSNKTALAERTACPRLPDQKPIAKRQVLLLGLIADC